jgi:ATP-dependent DNA helicase DinG
LAAGPPIGHGIICAMPSIVAIDIETTGLDPNKDAITEIGAVRFNGKRVEAEWSTLINPNRPIPTFISQLTGISNEMVRNAPTLKTMVQDLAAFVGDSPVLGHSVRFDLGFLQKSGILTLNEAIDTYEMAGVLLPTASRYNLGALGRALGILMTGEQHRALDDARLTHQVFNQLYEQALILPIELIAEFVRLSEPFEWGAGWIFTQILKARAHQPVQARGATGLRGVGHAPLFDDARGELPPPPLAAEGEATALNVDEVAAVLEHGGPFSHYFEAYEYRPQQVEMLRAVSNAFSQGYHLMVEAGTGTGKSFAYLVPAALYALQNNTRVIISTNTINLQDQLIKKDIPDLSAALGLDLRAVVLKGRGNYLCPRRLEILRQRGPENGEEMRVLAKILVWLQGSQTGDRSEINLNGPAERDVWSRLSAEDEGCKTEVCVKRTGGACPFYRVRQAAQGAHLLVVNHALLLADAATGNRVLPEYNFLVVDEAHHIEEATTSAMSFRIGEGDMARLMRELGGSTSGMLGRFLGLARGVLRPSDQAAVTQLVQRSTDLAFRLDNYCLHFFNSVEVFLAEQREGRQVGLYAQQERILPATRSQPHWTEVEVTWDQAHDTLKLLLNILADLQKGVADILEGENEELEDVVGGIGNLYRRLDEIDNNLTALVSQPTNDKVYWAEIQPNGNRLSLQAAPLHIGPLMERYLWHEKSSVILTSATLTAGGEFDYLRGRLNADEADELMVGSPFDYETAALVYVVNDIPEPADANGHQRAVEQALVRLAKATGGRMLALFTSYAQLKRTSQAISAPLSDAGITLFEQGEGASANTLLETFRETEKGVLLGTKSFWEGVDIPGEALSVLAIIKLPFDVPTDPIVAARSETFEDAFSEYSLPEAILRFRQGFGRLIRTQTDRGVVAILDKRILTKRYGRSFLDSLPECTVKQGPLSELPRLAAQWLNL